MYYSIYKLVCMAYSMVLRGLLKKAIDNPDEVWDEWTLELLDKLFDYDSE